MHTFWGVVGSLTPGPADPYRDSNYIVADPGTAARHVLRLINLVKSRVHDSFHVELELEISVW